MNVLVAGGSGGIGSALIRNMLDNRLSALAEPIEHIWATHWQSEPPFQHPLVTWVRMNAANEESVAAAARQVPHLTVLINGIGTLHGKRYAPEKTIKTFDPLALAANIDANTLPTLLLAKHFQQHFRGQGDTVFAALSARVGSISDNKLGGWYSYRASKAAMNMALKCLALEWQRSLPHMRVAALHPGTTDTQLSLPFQHNVSPAKLFSTERSAEQLIRIIKQLKHHDSGGFWSWDGTQLPW